MSKNRLEAFSDGVIAIVITIMVLELKPPETPAFASLYPLAHVFTAYLLSFVYLGIYWNNHHHMFLMVHRVSGKILWANLHLLFWLSLVPFSTGWMGRANMAPVPTLIYGTVLLCSAIAYYILQQAIIAHQGKDSKLKEAVGKDLKGKLSPVLYLLSLPLAFLNGWLAMTIYVLVAILWIVPDRRIEAKLT